MTTLPDLEPAAPDVPADIVKAAEVAADMVGVTPYSDMRVHVEYAARYALLADRAARSVPEAGKAVVKPLVWADGDVYAQSCHAHGGNYTIRTRADGLWTIDGWLEIFRTRDEAKAAAQAQRSPR